MSSEEQVLNEEEVEEEEEDRQDSVKVDARAVAPPGFFDDEEEEEDILDAIASARLSSLGSNNTKPVVPVVPFADDPAFAFITSKEMATSAQRKELEDFLRKHDPGLARAIKAGDLLVVHKLADVACALKKKYKGELPPSWTVDDAAPTDEPPISPMDYKINEILDTEMTFLATMTEVKLTYLDVLYAALGNPKHVPYLGLALEEANQIFEQIPAVCNFSQQLLYRLEYVNLVRKQPITDRSRALYVGEAFLEMAPKLHAYVPAITSYQNSLQLLTDAGARLPKLKKSSKYRNYLQLWEEVTAGIPVLRGQQLNAVLITPMQRLIRYKMLLERLAQDCDAEQVQKALELFGSATRNMNENMRSHEKLVGFFGSELKAVTSADVSKNGEVKLVSKYLN